MNDKETSAEIQEYNARYASGEYSGGRAGYKNNFIRFIGDSLRKLPVSLPRILDIGCGDGFFTETLARHGEVTATDFSEAGLRRARERLPDVRFFAHDLGQPFPLEADSFDVAWCSEVLEHLFAPAFTAGEVYRVLKPGGVFMITVPYHGLLKNLGIALFAFDRHYDPEYPHIRFFTKNTLRQILVKHGFTIEFMGSCGSDLGLRDWLVPTNILCVARKPGKGKS
jgi:SAM-dependent methyltransferase